MNEEITLDDAITNCMYGYNTSYDGDSKEVLCINSQCGRCGNYIQETGVLMAGYFCKDCR